MAIDGSPVTTSEVTVGVCGAVGLEQLAAIASASVNSVAWRGLLATTGALCIEVATEHTTD